MLIAHISLPADHTQATATVLAEILEGEALPFPPGGPGAWIAWAGDESIEIEVTPRGEVLAHGPNEVEWRPAPQASRYSECHAAIVIGRPIEDVARIAERAGWPARVCDRGGFFHVLEVWVEGGLPHRVSRCTLRRRIPRQHDPRELEENIRA